MARHSRNIDHSNSSRDGQVTGGLRTLVSFEREDLLVQLNLIDPVSSIGVKLPLKPEASPSHLIGVNIQDVIVPRFIAPDKKKDPNATGGRYVRTLRSDAEYFRPAEKRVSNKPESFLNATFLTGGKSVFHEDDVVRVRKQSTVSISTVAFKLAIAMEGGFEEARNRIADLAADAWQKDIERARQLYLLVNNAEDKQIDEELIPPNLKASATISQEIESKILKSACIWFGIDPESPLPKAKRGKRAKRKPRNYFDGVIGDIEEESHEGDFIMLTLRGESLRGALIEDFQDLPKGTDLNSLAMLSLVELLGALKEKDHETDAELLEAYLNSSWPNWQERIGGLAAEPQSDDPWEILGVGRGASKAEIKKAYHRVMMRVHPDQSGLSSYFSILVSNAYKKLIAEGI